MYTWPTSTLGAHTLTATHNVADDNAGKNSGSTSVTVNLPSIDVAVTGIDPSSGATGMTVNVTVSGTNFANGASLAFQNGRGKPPTVSNVVFVNSNTVTADVTISSKAKTGILWDVTVTNTDGGSGTLSDGFTVT